MEKGLSIAAPVAEQTLSGTVAVAAAGIAGAATDLTFRLGAVEVDALSDGTATIDTRFLSDGPHTLRATAIVGGEAVEDAVDVVVTNALPSSGTVGAAGGALKSAGGSYAVLPPGALASSASISLEDTTQQEILGEFGIDYPALGVTFLGALTLDGNGGPLSLPVQVDLAGWAAAVQPGHQVVMFTTGPDADGDGIGELMFAADAQATPDGSVITRPVPAAEVHGIGTVGTLGLQQSTRVRPGAIVTVVGRGFNPTGWLSNVARFGGDREVLAWTETADDAAFNPLMEVRFAVPALSSGSRSAHLHNLTTGYRSDPVALDVLAVGSGTASDWAGFVDQLRLAAEALTAGRADVAALADGWLGSLDASTSSTAHALARNSGLVSAANRAALAGIAGALSDAQRDLVLRHALVADAVGASVSELASPAADIATLLMVTAPARLDAAALRLQQAGGGGSCSGTASSSATSVVFGNPTGMGSAPPGGCASGGGAGGGSGGAGGASMAINSASLRAATTSLRPGAFRPVAGAYVAVYRPEGDRLSPFTAVTDATGYFHLPFIPANEPFVVRAVDPATGDVASFESVGAGASVRVPVQLVFGSASGPGSPTASFAVAPSPRGTLQGSWYWEFDASASSDPDGEIAEYIWNFGGVPVSVDWTPVVSRGYGRNGTYDVSLVVVDDVGNTAVASQELTINDLPYDYWGVPPERVNETASGEASNREPWYGYAISADGRYITFTTDASNLDPADQNGLDDLYLKDMQTGELALVSRGASGFEVWSSVAMSSDARYIAYTEEDTPSFGTGPNEIVILDRSDGTTQEVVNPDGYRSNRVIDLSDDGQRLLFQASSLNNPDSGTYLVELDTDTFTRIGLRTDGTTYARVTLIAISGDGRWVVFESADPDLIENDVNGRSDVFVYDLETGATSRASETVGGVGGDRVSDAYGQVISADGRYVAFWSEATNFFAGDTNDDDDVFVKDMVTGALDLVSANAWGERADSASILPVISGDGRYVAFGSYAENLAPHMDPYDPCTLGWCHSGFAYVKDLATGRVAMVSVGMNDTVPDDWDQIEPILSADGRYVGFYSWASNLVPGDTVDTMDYFRVENPLWEP